MSRDNSVTLIGVIGSEVELKVMRKSLIPVVEFISIDSDEQPIPCSAFGDVATTISRTVRKGQLVSLCGSLYTYPVAGKNGSYMKLAVKVERICVGEGEKKPSVYDIA